jgi:hypothetical protein
VRERPSNGTATGRVVEVLKSVHARHGH